MLKDQVKDIINPPQRSGMKKNLIIYMFGLFLTVFCNVCAFAASTESCVMCHTSDSLMKSLHKPPPMPAGEGEG